MPTYVNFLGAHESSESKLGDTFRRLTILFPYLIFYVSCVKGSKHNLSLQNTPLNLTVLHGFIVMFIQNIHQGSITRSMVTVQI
jgi:hypothetical protein